MELNEILSCCNETNNKKRWKDLKELYKKSAIAPFVGAGMSAPVYPLWAQSMKNILHAFPDEETMINSYTEAGQFEEACEYVRNKLGTLAFNNRVQEEFSVSKIQDNIDQIKKVNTSYLPEVFNGPIFTTNFDRMLEHFYGFKTVYHMSNMKNAQGAIYAAIRKKEHNLYKIHGDVEEPISWVFTKQRYEEVYSDECFVAAVKTACESMNFLFLGCSLTENDRYIKVLSEVSNEIAEKGGTVGSNYAFVEMPNPNEIDGTAKQSDAIKKEIERQERFFERIGVKAIWYPYRKYEAIPVLLRALKDEEIVPIKFEDDKTQDEHHYSLFMSNKHVKDIFVDDCFTYYKNLDYSSAKPINFEDIMKLVKTDGKDILFIEGNYGYGKTILSKRIQWELKDKKTLFFNAESLQDKEITDKLKLIKEKCYVFVDGLDKLIEKNIKIKDLVVAGHAIRDVINENRYISFIVNSRLFCNVGNGGKNDLISLWFAIDGLEREKLDVIRTEGFKEENYCEFFAKLNTDANSYHVTLTKNIIKEWHKKSPSSCQVPLFAYVIGTYYYEQQEKGEKDLLPNNKLSIYEKFVDDTIRGRFWSECRIGSNHERNYNKYRLLLQKCAVRMIHEMREMIDYSEDTVVSQELKEDEVYAISICNFDDELQKQLSEMYLLKKEEGEGKTFLSDAINNYFFCVYPSDDGKNWRVRFSDLNVMCCFAASYIYDVIHEISEYKDENAVDNSFEKIMADLRLVELQPQVLDFLMYKIEAMNKPRLQLVLTNILRYIKKYDRKQVVAEGYVRAMLVLYVVFVKFYKKSYNKIEPQNFFKTFYRLCMTAKALNINGEHHNDGNSHRYLVERYFMGCSFIGYTFKRLNYKYYNFTRCIIRDSTFEQCNFLDNLFVDAEMKEVTFNLCTIDTGFKNTIFRGIVTIKQSVIKKGLFEKLMSKSKDDDNNDDNDEDYNGNNGALVIFDGCTISEEMTICNTTTNLLAICFQNCILKDLKIRTCKKILVHVHDCIFKFDQKISLDSNSIIYSDDRQFFEGGKVKELDNLADTDFRKSSMRKIIERRAEEKKDYEDKKNVSNK